MSPYHHPLTVIVYPASGGGPIGICPRGRAKHLVKHQKAEWVFHRGELDGPTIDDRAREVVVSQIAIRLQWSHNPRRDNPPDRLTVAELAHHLGYVPEDSAAMAANIIPCAPYRNLPGGGSALGLEEALYALTY